MSAIGSIGLAHVGEIGNNTLEIAQDKSGIYKFGCPALTLVQDEYSVMQALESAAARIGASSFTIVHRLLWLEKLDIGLAGPHQVTNASLALHIVQAALLSHKCPEAFKRAAEEMQDPRYRPPVIVQPAQPLPCWAKSGFYGFHLVARYPRLAVNALVMLAIVTYYAVQHCLRTYAHGNSNATASVVLMYLSAAMLIVLKALDKYKASLNRRHAAQEDAQWEQEARSARRQVEMPSVELSPSLRCGRVYRALAATRWPGRAEVLKDPDSSAVLYLDVSHALSKATVLEHLLSALRSVRAHAREPRARQPLVFERVRVLPRIELRLCINIA